MQITRAMGTVRDGIAESKEDRARKESVSSVREPLAFSPAGQATQIIVGATDASDAVLLETSASLYSEQQLRRVYYSAFSPIPDASSLLPPTAPPLLREHRLYQADWLMRFYGFGAGELTTSARPNLELDFDPKMAWALRNRDRFPVDVNTASREELLRIPGVGVRSVKRMLSARRWRRLRLDDLQRLKVALSRARPFITAADYTPGRMGTEAPHLASRIRSLDQLDLWQSPLVSARTGEL